MYTFKHDERYTIEPIKDSTWLRVRKEGKTIAIVVNFEAARQVVYNEAGIKNEEEDYREEEVRGVLHDVREAVRK